MTAQLSFLTDRGDLSAAVVARDQGMASALAHAEADCASWPDLAIAYLRKYAEKNQEFAAFMVVGASELDGDFPIPYTAKAWGQIFRKAVKIRIIENSGKFTPHPQRHACPAAVWRSLVYRL